MTERATLEFATAEASDIRAHHELRKRVKHLRHQLEFLSPASPETLVPMAEGFHRRTDLLGDANDLAVLETHASSAPSVADIHSVPISSSIWRRVGGTSGSKRDRWGHGSWRRRPVSSRGG